MGIPRALTIGLLFLFTANVSARQISKDDGIEVVSDFSDGMNTQKAAHKLKISEAEKILNAYVDEKPSSLVERNGMIVAYRCPYISKVNFGFEQVFDDGSRKLYVSDSSTVYSTSDGNTWTLVKATLTTTAQLRAVAGRGFTFFTNGVDPVFISSGGSGIPLDGNNGRPNVPRGSIPAFYQERFWVGKTTDNPSAIHFMALTGDDGYILSITSNTSWPVTNQLNIGQGDGLYISGASIHRGQLRWHKSNRAIFTIFGTDETNYFARKTNSDSGAATHESIAQSDNAEYYFADDGINASLDANSQRISDDIFPDMQLVISNLSSIQNQTYDSLSDFMRGMVSNSTISTDGVLSILSTKTIVNRDGGVSTAFNSVSASSTTFAPVSSANANDTWEGFVTRMEGAILDLSGGGFYIGGVIKNTRTGEIEVTSTYTVANSGSTQLFSLSSTGPYITTADLRNGRVEAQFFMEPGISHSVSISSISESGIKATTNTAAFVTDVVTATAITLWDTLETLQNTGGGSINYFVKAATSLINVSTFAQYSSIMSGNTIPYGSSYTYLMVMATISARGIEVTTNTSIDYITVNWNQGGAADSNPKGIEWKKRYLLLCSTVPSGNVSALWVKSKISNSKPNAFTQFTFSNDYFRSIFKFNDNLYLGSGSTGTVYRFDYGTNDNGSPINFVVEKEFIFGSNFFEKNVYEYLVDADAATGATLEIGTSEDGGSYDDLNFSLNGSGRITDSVSGVNYSGKSIKVRILNSELDKQVTLHGLGIIYQKTRIK